MTDDELDRRLRSARPDTVADDGWTGSAAGAEAFAAIQVSAAAVPTGSRLRTRLLMTAPRPARRRVAYGAVVAAALVAVVVAVGSTASVDPGRTDPLADPTTSRPAQVEPAVVGPRPQQMALASYTDCRAMVAGLRAHTAARVTAYGLPTAYSGIYYDLNDAHLARGLSSSLPVATSVTPSGGQTSTTNVQEAGVDEPDTVKTDGHRVVSISRGVLRVIDAASLKVTGSLDLTMYAGAAQAQLLVSGDRALVVLGGTSAGFFGPMIDPGFGGYGGTADTGYLLVDLSGPPAVIGTLHPKGSYVDARMIDGTIRLVVQSAPTIALPAPPVKGSLAQRKAHFTDVVHQAPLADWLPSYTVGVGAKTTTHAVPCSAVRHPASYTGLSLLTVYSIDVAAGLGDVHPITLAADGNAVYATPTSLYIASQAANSAGRTTTTQLHRFDISHPGRPRYLGSGTVPGQLLDSYSMSDFDGSLRVVTSIGAGFMPTSTSLYVLDAATLRVTGHVGGLGANERVYAVRFVGPLAYVVTFRQVDPLYVLDLSDPKAPRKAGELTISGYSGYLHPVGAGRVLGVGQDASTTGRVRGLQVSLFDVTDPARPSRLARTVLPKTPGEGRLDPHAFLYWPATGTAVVPIQTWSSPLNGSVLVLHVARDGLTELGTVSNPTTTADRAGIQRTLVVDGALWTVSASGVAISDLTTLQREGFVPFD